MNVYIIKHATGEILSVNRTVHGCATELYGLDVEIHEEELQPYDAYNADEAFLTTSTYCVLPVNQVDNRNLNSGVPGPIGQRLLAAWSELAGIDFVDQALQQANR